MTPCVEPHEGVATCRNAQCSAGCPPIAYPHSRLNDTVRRAASGNVAARQNAQCLANCLPIACPHSPLNDTARQVASRNIAAQRKTQCSAGCPPIAYPHSRLNDTAHRAASRNVAACRNARLKDHARARAVRMHDPPVRIWNRISASPHARGQVSPAHIQLECAAPRASAKARNPGRSRLGAGSRASAHHRISQHFASSRGELSTPFFTHCAVSGHPHR
ncbi:hypothetical protein BPA30113_03071 [Burkholderia paludis]|uniref:Uncharacterized protein n=1 Tax=Burkholderia paludis TaxID=1506587 RepID=A0A6J5END5_9BURK|nr:hypothetical protein LMG30113_05373 [Burkholderia paludis]VWB68449.1 hypothetical protein BPA30113_03071 [Burkholderia paludis]